MAKNNIKYKPKDIVCIRGVVSKKEVEECYNMFGKLCTEDNMCITCFIKEPKKKNK